MIIACYVQVKVAAEEALKMKFEVYKAIEYSTQVVAGTNFMIIVSERHKLHVAS